VSPRTSPKKSELRILLFVAGDSPNSVTARRNLQRLFKANPSVVVELEIVDVLKEPEAGIRANVLVTPTLVRLTSLGEHRIIGNLNDTGALASLLELGDPNHD
jgi:circadian clock protein KaiB